eukprot:scaffold10795_cov193-Alexandrium_tamarense.AAC.11
MGNTQGSNPTFCSAINAVDVQGDEDSGWLFNVLDFCDRETRHNCLFVTNRYCHTLTTDASFRWRLERLHIEHGVYFSTTLSNDKTWRALYLELDKKRQLWEADQVDNQEKVKRDERGDQFSIAVYARLKPLDSDSNRVLPSRKAILPLHQRLALIRIDKGIASKSDALLALKEQGGWFKDKWSEIEHCSADRDETTSKEDDPADSLTSGIKMIDANNSRVVVVDSTKGLLEFEFDGVLEDNVCQNHVYAISTRGLVCDVLNGVSATCLVYGMTGSGKSFTMFGGEEEAQTVRSNLIGIVPRACSEIMDAIRYRKEALNLDLECTVSVSFVEVYGNDILDLLKRGSRCGQSKVSAQRSVLDGSAEVTVNDVNDVMRLLSVGEAQKRKATTAMNARSSRAHSVFIVSLQQRCRDTGKSMNSKLFLADLGGCEQTKKSQLVAGKSNHIEALKELNKGGTEPEHSTGFVKSDRMREAVYINLGLMSLKACVEALTRGNHVPYANSKLTMLLASGLGGNSKTAVIVCAAQEDEHSSETINAFKFGQSCRQVSNTVRSQADVLGDLMKELDTEIASCEDRIRLNEKWVVKEDTREDLGGVEVKKTTVLVGAEKDRKLLNKLLAKKSQLSGSSDKDDTDSHSFGGNIGFGKAHEYGLGKKFSSDAEKENYRFNKTPKEELVPSAVLREPVKINKAAKVGRLAYSGISA